MSVIFGGLWQPSLELQLALVGQPQPHSPLRPALARRAHRLERERR